MEEIEKENGEKVLGAQNYLNLPENPGELVLMRELVQSIVPIASWLLHVLDETVSAD